jgi:hypothetical protein
MYDFSSQANMLGYAIDALKEVGVYEQASLGGGTALSAYYWNHRYSTDIDMFLTTSGSLPKLRLALQKMNISDDIRFPGNYLEILISETEKIQFFETHPRMPQGRILTSLWEFNEVYIESIEEILVKKIYYRAHKGNTRDIFDIAVGLSKNPHFFGECLSKGGLSQEHLSVFKNTLTQIMDNKDLLKIYQDEIALMDPAKEYFEIAINAPKIILANLKTNVIA